jgi:hypothetical protein
MHILISETHLSTICWCGRLLLLRSRLLASLASQPLQSLPLALATIAARLNFVPAFLPNLPPRERPLADSTHL